MSLCTVFLHNHNLVKRDQCQWVTLQSLEQWTASGGEQGGKHWQPGSVNPAQLAGVRMKVEPCEEGALLPKLTCWINLLTHRPSVFGNLALCTPTSDDVRVFVRLQMGLEWVSSQTVRIHIVQGLLCRYSDFSKSCLYQTSSRFAESVTFNSAAIWDSMHNPGCA